MSLYFELEARFDSKPAKISLAMSCEVKTRSLSANDGVKSKPLFFSKLVNLKDTLASKLVGCVRWVFKMPS